MVQIKDIICFNSNMVRLKVCEAITRLHSSRMFQFQYGSIKSLVGYGTQYQNNSFNSNMVRLKGTKTECLQNLKPSFNSNMVRLKVNIGVYNSVSDACFNSNMVRLKG